MEDIGRYPKKWAALGIVFASILLPFIFTAFFIRDQEMLMQGEGQVFIFLGEALILLPSLWYARRKGYTLKALFRWRFVPGAVILWAIVAGLSISVLADELDRLMTYLFNPPEWLTQTMEMFRISYLWDLLLLFGGISVIAPVAEEFLFRGFLQTSLEYREQAATKAILITALAFALLHLNTWWIVQIYLFGVVLSYFSWRTQSVFPGIFVHMTINSFSILFTNLTLREELSWYESGNHVSPVWLVLAAGGLYYSFHMINGFFPLDDRHSETILEAPDEGDLPDRES